MNTLLCALLVLAAVSSTTLSKSVPRRRDRCEVMRCANGCVNGKCIEVNDTCPPNMHEEECGSACRPRCDIDLAATSCIAMCVKGCFCNEGYILDKADGVCIPQEECPKTDGIQEDNVDKCATVRCQGGYICQDGQCIRNPNCPMFKLAAPQPGCEYVDEIDENGCAIPKQQCPASTSQ